MWGQDVVKYASTYVLQTGIAFVAPIFENPPKVFTATTKADNVIGEFNSTLKVSGITKTSFLGIVQNSTAPFNSGTTMLLNWFAIGI